MKVSKWIGIILGGWWFLFSLPVAAEQARLLLEEGPYFTGVPIDLQVAVEGFEESPQPTIQVDQPETGQLELTGVSPNVSSSIQIINGHMKQWKSVRFNFNYRWPLATQTLTAAYRGHMAVGN